jgi:hypothetical protein
MSGRFSPRSLQLNFSATLVFWISPLLALSIPDWWGSHMHSEYGSFRVGDCNSAVGCALRALVRCANSGECSSVVLALPDCARVTGAGASR